MKQNILFVTLLVFVLTACKQQSPSHAIFYDENNYNIVKEIKGYNNRLYILGQHFIKDNSVTLTSSFLCIDTSLYRRWDIHLGNVNDKEWFESFCIDANGNIYIAGYNGKTNKAELIKLNAKGQFVFKKDYAAFAAFKNIALLQDTAVIVTAIKHLSDTTLMQDSVYIQKLDGEGNVTWQTPLGLFAAPGYLKTAGSKIIFLGNMGLNRLPLVSGQLFCIDSLGRIPWQYSIPNVAIGINTAVKAVNLKVDSDTAIYTLCESYDGSSMALLKFNMSGGREGIYKPDFTALGNARANAKDNSPIFLFTGRNLDLHNKEPLQLIVRKDKHNVPYFAATAAGNQLVDFIPFNNSLYEIANTGDLANHISAWEVIKEGK